LHIVNSEEASASLRCIQFNDKELSDTTFVTSMTAVLEEGFWAERLQHAQQLIESTCQALEEVKGTLEELGKEAMDGVPKTAAQAELLRESIEIIKQVPYGDLAEDRGPSCFSDQDAV
jgi:hypothetical protein